MEAVSVERPESLLAQISISISISISIVGPVCSQQAGLQSVQKQLQTVTNCAAVEATVSFPDPQVPSPAPLPVPLSVPSPAPLAGPTQTHFTVIEQILSSFFDAEFPVQGTQC